MSYDHGVTTVTDNTVSSRASTQYLSFDHGGRLVVARDQDGQASFSKFDGRGARTQASDVQQYINNLAKNHSFETNSDWYANNSAVYDTTQKYLGNRSAKVTCANQSSYAAFIEDIPVVPGKTYTISAYVKLTSPIVGNYLNGYGAYVGFGYKTSNGSFNWGPQSEYLFLQNDWTKISCTFTAPWLVLYL